MNSVFYKCISLSYFPNFNKWNTGKVYNNDKIFFDCIHILSIPLIKSTKVIIHAHDFD